MNGIIEGMDGIDLRHKLDNKYGDIFLPVDNLRKSAVTPPGDYEFIGNIYQTGFAGGGQNTNDLYGAFELHHDWKEGTKLDIHIHWGTKSAATANTVKWCFEYSKANVNQTFTTTALLSLTTTPSGVRKHQYGDLGDITMTGYTVGAIVLFRLYRDPNQDTFTSTAFAFSIGAHYIKDGIGSNSETLKY